MLEVPEGSKIIPLSSDKYALVDASDYEYLMQWKWSAIKAAKSEHWQAVRMTSRREPHRRLIKMHRFLMGLDVGDSMEVDHINCNPLDNRRCNLRICTHRQNMRNRAGKPNRSGFKGVSWKSSHKSWRARIYIDGKEVLLGYFKSAAKAHEAYCRASNQHYGEFANHHQTKG